MPFTDGMRKIVTDKLLGSGWYFLKSDKPWHHKKFGGPFSLDGAWSVYNSQEIKDAALKKQKEFWESQLRPTGGMTSIKMVKIERSGFLQVGYDETNQLLVVDSRDGKRRVFLGVPEDVWWDFQQAQNADQFYLVNILDKFQNSTPAEGRL